MRYFVCVVLMLCQFWCVEKLACSSAVNWTADLQKIFESTKQPGVDGFNLADLIDMAFSNNPDLQAMWLQYRQSVYTHSQSLGAYYPSVDVEMKASRQRIPGYASDFQGLGNTQTQGQYSTNYRPAATLSFLLFDFGQREGTVKAAYSDMVNANWSYRWKMQEVLRDVLKAYYTYWDSRAGYQASLEDLEDARRSLDAAEERRKAGIVTLYDVLQARSLYAKQKMNSVQLFGSMKINFGQLVDSIGLPIDSIFDVIPPSMELHSLKVMEDMGKLMQLAEVNRADLRAQRADVDSQHALMKQAMAKGFPSIGFDFSAGDAYYNRISTYGATKGIDFLGVLALKVPIFKGFADINRYRSQRQAWKAAQSLLLSKQLEINFEVLQSYYNVQTAGKNLLYSQEFYEAASENYGIAMANYKSGIGSILDLLSAQSSLAEARESRVGAHTGWYLSIVDLSNATGVLSPPNAKGNIDGNYSIN